MLKNRCVLCVLLSMSFTSYTSASYIEQQEAINKQYFEQFDKSESMLNEKIQTILSSSHEGLEEFKSMIPSWIDFIGKKCAFVTNESKGTDAEIASVLSCKTEEYKKMTDYLLKSVINMP